MSLLRPARRVTAPDGSCWEIYTYRLEWRRPARLRDLPRAAVAAARTLGGTDWTVDAVTQLPRPMVYTWTTTSERKGQVLAQIAGGLERGTVPTRLAHASYLGEDSRSVRYRSARG